MYACVHLHMSEYVGATGEIVLLVQAVHVDMRTKKLQAPNNLFVVLNR